MKLRLSFIVSVIMLSGLSAMAKAGENDPFAEKRKTYSKTYPLSSGDRVRLNNQFGEMKIIQWDKNETKVDITIVTKASSDEYAQKILDRISIEDGKNGSEVFFKTNMKNNNDSWQRKDKGEYKEQSMKIDYAVYMPVTGSLDATNQFGAMFVPDYKGAVKLESKFGSLNAGRLSNAKDVSVEFGTANIESMQGGKFTIKFSSGEIKNMGGNMVMRVEFCDKLKVSVDNNLKDFDLKTSYSTVYLDASNDLSAKFEIRTSFGDFSNKTSFAIKEDRDDDEDRRGPKFDKNFKGNAGSGSNNIKIKSDFGEVVLGHNISVDFTEKKNKKKTKVI
jgi:hypothetical protein